MRKARLSRRRLLVGAGTTLAAAAVVGDPAAGQAQVGPISAELVTQLAQYTGVPPAPDRLEPLATQLRDSLAALRAMRPEGWDEMVPASIFSVPRGVAR
jgi:hypothetical protein